MFLLTREGDKREGQLWLSVSKQAWRSKNEVHIALMLGTETSNGQQHAQRKCLNRCTQKWLKAYKHTDILHTNLGGHQQKYRHDCAARYNLFKPII